MTEAAFYRVQTDEDGRASIQTGERIDGPGFSLDVANPPATGSVQHGWAYHPTAAGFLSSPQCEEARPALERAQIVDQMAALGIEHADIELDPHFGLPVPLDGQPWSQPQGVLGAYPAGRKVTHGGHTWTSDLDWNVWEPGVYGWTKEAGPEPEEPEPPVPTVAAWSATTTYTVGARCTKDGRVWECLVAHGPERQGTWAPGPATPTVWRDIGPA